MGAISDPATLKQHQYLKRLVEQKELDPTATAKVMAGQDLVKAKKFSKGDAGQLIDLLKQLPNKENALPGFYFFGGKFYRVIDQNGGTPYVQDGEASWTRCSKSYLKRLRDNHRVDVEEARVYAEENGVCIFCGKSPAPEFVYYHPECQGRHEEPFRQKRLNQRRGNR